MARKRFDNWTCSVARTMDILNDAWGVLIVREAFYGTKRFDDFRDQLGVSRNVLSSRLERLVDAGVLRCEPYQTKPQRFNYLLTDKGKALFDVILAMMRFGDDWLCSPQEGAPVELTRADDGSPVAPMLVDANTGEPIRPQDVRVEPGPGMPEELREQFKTGDRRNR